MLIGTPALNSSFLSSLAIGCILKKGARKLKDLSTVSKLKTLFPISCYIAPTMLVNGYTIAGQDLKVDSR